MINNKRIVIIYKNILILIATIFFIGCSTLSGNINYEIYDQYNKGIDFRKMGYEFFEKGNYEKAQEYYFGAYKIFTNIDNNEKTIGIISDIINLYNRIKDFEKSKSYIDKGLEYLTYEKITSKEVGFFYQSVGDYYNFTNNNELALESYNKAINYFRMNNEEENIATTYLIIGKVYSKINDMNKALKYLDDAIFILENLYKKKKLLNFENLSSSYYIRSIHFHNNGNYKKSIEYIKKTIEYDRIREKTYNLAQNYYVLAINYYKLKDYKPFLFYINKSITISKNSNNYEVFSKSTEALGDYYQANGDFVEAIRNYIFSYNVSTEIINNKNHKNRVMEKIVQIVNKENLEEKNKKEIYKILTNEIKESINSSSKQ